MQQLAKDCFSRGTVIWAFGSRGNGTCHDTSDLDLVIHPAKNLSPAEAVSELRDFKEALQDSNLVILVDVFLWEQIPELFQQEIQRHYEVLHF